MSAHISLTEAENMPFSDFFKPPSSKQKKKQFLNKNEMKRVVLLKLYEKKIDNYYFFHQIMS